MTGVERLERISTMTEAIAAAAAGSRVAPKLLADRLGIEYSHFQRMLSSTDSRNFPPDLLPTLMHETGSLLPLEWLAFRMGFCLHEQSLTGVLKAIRESLTRGETPKFSFSDYSRNAGGESVGRECFYEYGDVEGTNS